MINKRERPRAVNNGPVGRPRGCSARDVSDKERAVNNVMHWESDNIDLFTATHFVWLSVTAAEITGQM